MIQIDDRLRSHIPALRAEEVAQLEQNLLRYGCQSALTLWRDILLDGHHRHSICRKHGLPFETISIDLPDIAAAIAWIEDNQIGRRNLTPDQFAYFVGRQYERRRSSHGGERRSSAQNDHLRTDERLAKEHGVSPATVRRHADFARDVDKLADAIGPQARTDILAGDFSRKDVAQAVQQLSQQPGVGSVPELLAGAEAARSYPLKIAIKFLKGAGRVESARRPPLYVFQDGWVFAWGPAVFAGHPMPGMFGSFGLPAAELDKVLALMKTEPTVQAGDGTIVLRAGRLSSSIDLFEVEPLTPESPEAAEPLPEGLFDGIKHIYDFFTGLPLEGSSNHLELQTGCVAARARYSRHAYEVPGLEVDAPIA